MRIALFSECYSPVQNGVVTSVTTLRAALRAEGHTVFVFAPGAPDPADDSEVFRLPALPFPRHPYHFARPFPRLSIDFGSLGVEIIHCQHPFTVGRLGADTARRYRLPMVYTAHSLYDTMIATSRSPLMRSMGQRAARGVVRRFCARADYVIAPSRHTRDALRADGVRARFAVVPNGIFAPQVSETGGAAARAALGIDESTPLVLCLGRLGPEKRVDVLLHAIALLRERGLPRHIAGFHLALVGDGQVRAELEQLTAELGMQDMVSFVGSQPHQTIGDWYAAADIFVLSSPAETQGLVLVEAMALGVPCIAADYGGPRELIAQNQNGLRVALEPEAFAAAIETLLKDPAKRHKFGENGRARAAVFSPESMARGVFEVYEMACRLPRPPSTAGPRRTVKPTGTPRRPRGQRVRSIQQ